MQAYYNEIRKSVSSFKVDIPEYKNEYLTLSQGQLAKAFYKQREINLARHILAVPQDYSLEHVFLAIEVLNGAK